MMPLKTTYIFALLLLGSGLLLSNKNGRASQAGIGNTGAPGDDTSPTGLRRTCGYCHAGSGISASIGIQLIDSTGSIVSAYLPGSHYTAKVKITPSTTALNGYGFQMIPLRQSNYTDVDGFSDVGTNNYKIATISNGRTYAEHAGVSNSDSFMVAWKAPASGTGTVVFYAAGNAVNKNNASAGDAPCNDSLIVTEAIVSASGQITGSTFDFHVMPNPLLDRAQIQLILPESGLWAFEVFSLSGRKMANWSESLEAGAHALPLDANNWRPGVYLLRIGKGAWTKTLRLVKT